MPLVEQAGGLAGVQDDPDHAEVTCSSLETVEDVATESQADARRFDCHIANLTLGGQVHLQSPDGNGPGPIPQGEMRAIRLAVVALRPARLIPRRTEDPPPKIEIPVPFKWFNRRS